MSDMHFARDFTRGILGRPDKPELWQDIISHIPENVFLRKNLKVLCVAAGHGTEADVVVKKMRELGVDIEDIKSSVYCLDLYEIFTNALSRRGYTNVIQKDFLEFKSSHKFDLVLGNLPKESQDESTYTNIWSDMYVKCFDLLKSNGYSGLVTPRTWATSKTSDKDSQTSVVKNIITNHAVHINLDECGRHFPEFGSTFTYSVCSKKPTKGKTVTLQTTASTLKITNLEKVMYRLPKNASSESISIFEKVFSSKMFQKSPKATPKGNMIHDRDRNNSNKDIYKYRVQFSFGTVKWSDTISNYQYDKKVIFPNQTASNFPIYDKGESAGPNRGAVFLVDSDTQGENFVKFCKSKLMQFVISEQRFHHGLLNTNVISDIPYIDLDKEYTDEEIYKLFDLTQSEINYIENH